MMKFYQLPYQLGLPKLGTAALGVLGIVSVVLLIVMGFAIAQYIMTSVALSRIASRRKISNGWMAWFPITRDWLIGKIADEYDGRNGIKRNWRALLLTLVLITTFGLAVIYGIAFKSVLVMVLAGDYAQSAILDLIGSVLAMYLIAIAVAVAGVLRKTFYMICIYKVFESTVPEKSVAYMIWYLLISFIGAICLVKCRNKGYSHVAQDVVVDVKEEVQQEAQEEIVEEKDVEIDETTAETK